MGNSESARATGAVHPGDTPASARTSRAGVLVAVAMAGFCAFLNLYAPQPLLPTLRQTFQASETVISMTIGASVLAVAVAAPLMGVLADAVGRKRIVISALLGLALTTALAGTAQGLISLIVWRFLQGLFIPAIIAVMIAYISEESPREVVGSTMATYVTGTVIGGFCGRFIAGLVTTHHGWRAAFVVLGSITVAGTLLTWWLLPRARRFVRQTDPAASIRALGQHLGNRQLLATYAVGFIVLFSLVGTFTYVGFHLAAPPFNLGTTALGTIFFVYLIGAVITPIAGRCIDRFGFRRTLAAALVMSASGIALTLATSLMAVIAGLALCSSGVFICQSAAAGHVGAAAGYARSSAAGLYVAFYYLGGSAGSYLPGLLFEGSGWPACVGLIVAMQLATAVFAYLAWRD